MYTIGGLTLDNTARGWGVDGRTRTLPERSVDLPSVSSLGRDGVISALAGTSQSPIWALYMRTLASSREALIALVEGNTKITVGTKTLAYSVAGVSIADENFAVGWSVVLFSLRLNDVFWRSASTLTSTALMLDSASVIVPNLFPGLSARVQDAIVRVKGAFTGLQVTDSAGSWFTYSDTITATQYLRFEANTGRAFRTGSADTWTGGTEVSGAIDFGGPRGVFEIAPAWTTDPAVRAGVLTVATASRTGSSVQVRGKAAFIV